MISERFDTLLHTGLYEGFFLDWIFISYSVLIHINEKLLEKGILDILIFYHSCWKIFAFGFERIINFALNE